ncbi:hypothetical protein C9374_002674 [Naegleria lovaniensis]|uniref:Uncharacterized protein n=1 Tax=Naegleria lovaniensis TaxID=51637 RepID=A0AA88KKY8_NAELO|nr:uncharacterized protein C9374_002674 [Naegleria lovaniensis]KAG2386228.1 hypothetical protein C9374_002674 [Naegleria lovaniensis]
MSNSKQRDHPLSTEASNSSFTPSLSTNTLLNIRELAEMAVYASLVGGLFGGIRGFLQIRKAHIPTSTLEKMRTNMFYRLQQHQEFTRAEKENEFNPNKNQKSEKQYDPKTARVDRKHIILGFIFHQLIRNATNAGVFAFTFSLADLTLRNFNIFNPVRYVNDDEKSKTSPHGILEIIHDYSEKFYNITLTDEQKESIEKSEIIKQRLNQLNLLHKPLAGALAGGVFGLLASVPNLLMGIGTMSSAISISTSSLAYGLLFGAVSAVFLLPLQSFYIVERLNRYSTVDKKQPEPQEVRSRETVQEVNNVTDPEQTKMMQQFVQNEQHFLGQLEKISEHIGKLEPLDEEATLHKQREDQK